MNPALSTHLPQAWPYNAMQMLPWEQHTVDLNRTREVGVDESVTVGNNQRLTVGIDRTKSVGANESDTIGVNWNIKVGNMEIKTIDMANIQNVGAVKMTNVGAVNSENTGLAKSVAVGMFENTAVGMDRAIEVGNNQSVTIGAVSKLSAGGMHEVNAPVVCVNAGTIDLEAANAIILHVGSSSIVLTPGGIGISAPIVTIDLMSAVGTVEPYPASGPAPSAPPPSQIQAQAATVAAPKPGGLLDSLLPGASDLQKGVAKGVLQAGVAVLGQGMQGGLNLKSGLAAVIGAETGKGGALSDLAGSPEGQAAVAAAGQLASGAANPGKGKSRWTGATAALGKGASGDLNTAVSPPNTNDKTGNTPAAPGNTSTPASSSAPTNPKPTN